MLYSACLDIFSKQGLYVHIHNAQKCTWQHITKCSWVFTCSQCWCIAAVLLTVVYSYSIVLLAPIIEAICSVCARSRIATWILQKYLRPKWSITNAMTSHVIIRSRERRKRCQMFERVLVNVLTAAVTKWRYKEQRPQTAPSCLKALIHRIQ